MAARLHHLIVCFRAQDFQAFNAAVNKEQGLPDGVPPVDMSVVKKKSFPMDPITVEEVAPRSRLLPALAADWCKARAPKVAAPAHVLARWIGTVRRLPSLQSRPALSSACTQRTRSTEEQCSLRAEERDRKARDGGSRHRASAARDGAAAVRGAQAWR